MCAPMNYSIYLLCRAEVCLETRLQTPKRPRVRSLICACTRQMFSRAYSVFNPCTFFFWSPHLSFGCFSHAMWSAYVLYLPPSPASFYRPLYGTCGVPAIPIGRHTALIFGQLDSVYMSVMLYPNSAKKDEFS